MQRIHIIGAGLAGLSAAVTLGAAGIPCHLISLQPSERAQSVLAEGGINAALDTMGEGDTPEQHFQDTMRGGVYLADPNAVANLTGGAPEIVRRLESLGVPFNRGEHDLILRNFGGQKRKRTAYAKSSTGKIIMTALIDEARKYEAAGLIRRLPHHAFLRLMKENGQCTGVRIRDCYSGMTADLPGTVLLCSGGMNGLFPGMTTGTTQNSGDVTAAVFAQGAALGNPEMLQYHPTTVGIPGKRMLVTEAARGEGGRLYILRGGEKWYFMEELHPELGNLSPRDVVARTMYFVRREHGGSVYLDMTALPEETWQKKLSDLREEIEHYLAIDPKTEPIPVQEGIHYFMGGLDTDAEHRTNLPGLYAAGECTCQYHGANRLGGNSMLGALYGGRRAAQTILREGLQEAPDQQPEFREMPDALDAPASPGFIRLVSDILLSGLGIVRNEQALDAALGALAGLHPENAREENRLALAQAMLLGARERRESRGAHYREDYPQQDDSLRKTTVAVFADGQVHVTFRPLPERRM